jgi:hypothetical protein
VRINTENNSIDIEARDINFILDNYAVSYKFSTKNAPIDRVIIPMFATTKTRYGEIKIEFVPDTSAFAKELVEDGEAVKEVSPVQADELAVQDARVQHLTAAKEYIDKATGYAGKPVLPPANPVVTAPVKTPIAREPKQPSGTIIPPGSGGLGLAPRDPNDLRHTKQDIAPEKDIDESKEKAVNVSKDDSGNKRIG